MNVLRGQNRLVLGGSLHWIFHMGPQIDGYRNIEQYKEYIYSINDSKAHTFYWTGKNIKIVSGQNSSTVTIVPTQPGNASVKVSYKYKNQTDNFTNELPLSVSKTSMQLIGPDVICDNGTFIQYQEFSHKSNSGLDCWQRFIFAIKSGITCYHPE